MKQDKVWRDFNALPPELQQQVVDLITFLRARSQLHKKTRRIPLEKEPAIGMWQDREDMRDSTAWVRQSRVRHWEGRRG